MTPYAYAALFLAAVAIGMCIPSWLDARRSARRHAAAELAFWEALMRVVDGTREDIEAESDFAAWEAEVSA